MSCSAYIGGRQAERARSFKQQQRGVALLSVAVVAAASSVLCISHFTIVLLLFLFSLSCSSNLALYLN